MFSGIPVLGWIVDVIFSASLAVPFWIAWVKCGIGAKFFYFLPHVYLDIHFWPCVGLFLCLGILRQFSPFRVSSSSTSNSK